MPRTGCPVTPVDSVRRADRHYATLESRLGETVIDEQRTVEFYVVSTGLHGRRICHNQARRKGTHQVCGSADGVWKRFVRMRCDVTRTALHTSDVRRVCMSVAPVSHYCSEMGGFADAKPDVTSTCAQGSP